MPSTLSTILTSIYLDVENFCHASLYFDVNLAFQKFLSGYVKSVSFVTSDFRTLNKQIDQDRKDFEDSCQQLLSVGV